MQQRRERSEVVEKPRGGVTQRRPEANFLACAARKYPRRRRRRFYNYETLERAGRRNRGQQPAVKNVPPFRSSLQKISLISPGEIATASLGLEERQEGGDIRLYAVAYPRIKLPSS